MDTGKPISLADAPFDREDMTLNPVAGACVTCPRRSGYNTSLFCDVQGDQCLDAPCYQTKVTAHIERELAARPELVQLETAWRSPKEQRSGSLQRHQYRELDVPDNPDAEPSCASTRTALVVFGKQVGRTLTVCTETDCPVHNPHEAARRAAEPAPVMAPAPEAETEEQAEQRKAEYEQQRQEYEAEQERKSEERRQEFERRRHEREAERGRWEEQTRVRAETFERILGNAPPAFTAAQLRFALRALLSVDPYSYLEEVTAYFAGEDENVQDSGDDILVTTLNGLADDKLTGFALRLFLADHTRIPRENEPDFLTEAAVLFPGPQPATKANRPKTNKPTLVKTTAKKVAKKVTAA